MNRVQFIKSLREAGGGDLQHEYDQGQDPRLRQLDITENGWCFGVSIQWLRFKKAGGNFWTWLGGEGAGAIRFMMVNSAVRDKLTSSFDSVDWVERASFYLKKFGFNRASYHRETAAPQVTNLATRMVGPGKFCRIDFGMVAGGGHTVAAINDAKAIVFMDPNVGEIRFSDNNVFRAWLPTFFTLINYGALTYFTVEKYN